MAGMARLEVIGNLGKPAELGNTANGAAKVTFSVAHSPRVQQGQTERTDWYRCTWIGARAQSVHQYLGKGQRVYVRGDFEARPWTNRDGAAQISLDLFVSELELLGSPEAGAVARAPERGAVDDLSGDNDMDIPF